MGKAFAELLAAKRHAFPFRITGIHTRRQGTAYEPRGLPLIPPFGPPAASIEEFLQKAAADVMVEITTLDPVAGEPATTHIRAAFRARMHVITANKGPIAHAYRSLCDEARRAGVEFRFESTCMDGAPVFNMVRNNLPGVTLLGFTGVLNSTSQIAIAAMREGLSMEEGLDRARAMGIAEADATFDTDGWDSAAKTAALANVLMNAAVTPMAVERRGIGRLTTVKVQQLAAAGKTVCLISRAWTTPKGLRLRVRGEVLDQHDLLASVEGTSNLLLLHTDLMGTVGTVSIKPGVAQTAYGLFSDLVDIARTV